MIYDKYITYILSLLLFLFGLFLIFIYSSYQIALGIFLLIWANNLNTLRINNNANTRQKTYSIDC